MIACRSRDELRKLAAEVIDELPFVRLPSMSAPMDQAEFNRRVLDLEERLTAASRRLASVRRTRRASQAGH